MECSSSSSDDRESGDDLYYDSEDARQPRGIKFAQIKTKLKEKNAYDFFIMIFEECEDLRKTYKEEYNMAQFDCFVCSSIPNKPIKRYTGLLSVVMHARKILNTKRLHDHRGYAWAICDLMGWDANGNPKAPAMDTPPRTCPRKPVNDTDQDQHKNSDVKMADFENELLTDKDFQNDDATRLKQNALENKAQLAKTPLCTVPNIFSSLEEAYKIFREQVVNATFEPGKIGFDKEYIHTKVGDKDVEGEEPAVSELVQKVSTEVEMIEVQKDVETEKTFCSCETKFEDEKPIEAGHENQSSKEGTETFGALNDADAECKDMGSDKDENSEVIVLQTSEAGQSIDTDPLLTTEKK